MEISNEKLASLNNISEQNYAAMSQEFRQQTHSLLTMKKQLDSCFRRIRSLKSKLATQYPEAYRGKGGRPSRAFFSFHTLVSLLSFLHLLYLRCWYLSLELLLVKHPFSYCN